MNYSADTIALQRLFAAAGQLTPPQIEGLAAAVEKQLPAATPGRKAPRKGVFSVIDGGLAGTDGQTGD